MVRQVTLSKSILSITDNGERAEQVVQEFLELKYPHCTIKKLVDKDQRKGDFLLLDKKKDTVYFIEVKSSHSWHGDRVGGDYKYYKKHSKEKGYSTPYIQENTRHNDGWFMTSPADILICYNHENKKLYIIADFPALQARILDFYNNGKTLRYYDGPFCKWEKNGKKVTEALGIILDQIPTDKFKVTVYNVEFI